jgi:hypothetical protein
MLGNKCLGSFVHGGRSIEEVIKERIALYSKANYANLKVFKSKLLSKKAELKVVMDCNEALINRAAKRGY